MMEVRGKRVLVVGLGRSGREVARILSARGSTVTVTDTRPPSAFQAEIPQMTRQKVGLELGRHREETFLHQDLIVVSPGVPWDMPHLVAARRGGVRVVPEVEAASWFLPGMLVGITGSNGKTTTTALAGEMIKASGLSTFVGGNIGVPLISAVDRTSAETVLVTELSSFQLEGIESFHPHIAVLLNLTPNHLDRHASFEAYITAKARIFRNQTPDDWAVLNADDPAVMNLAPSIAARKVFFSRRRNLPDGVFASNGHIRYRVSNLERVLLGTREVPLRGEFNVENVLAAATAACLVGADFSALAGAVRNFKGVEHRLEFVRTLRGVEFYNDSKATSVDATSKALSAFEHGVHLILGGKDKGAPYAPLRPLMQGRVREVLLIGAAAERIERELKGAVEMIRTGDLETGLREAFKRAVPGHVVLLAPACASYDQFEDFEHRGRVFKKLTSELARAVEMGEIDLPPAPVEVPAPALARTGSPAESESVPEPQPAMQAVAPEAAASEPAAQLTAPMAESPASGADSVDATEPASPAPRELTYIYEVGAKQLEPAGDQPPLDLADDDFKPLEPEELRPPESLDDEALFFEVRTNGGGNSAVSEEKTDESNTVTESKTETENAAAPPAPVRPTET
jgi:UDP-N-acetylmuramoylalanine--D-glutamate ligase